LSSITSEEARVTALASSSISLSSIFFVVGPKCLSTDEMFKAMQYKKMLEAWEQRIKERNCLLDEKLKHDACREAALKVAPKKPDYDAMLRWEMGADKYKSDAKGSRIDKLKLLWEQYKDVEPPSIVVPEEEEQPPPIPAITETALGEAPTKYVKGAVLPNLKNVSREAILDFKQLLDAHLDDDIDGDVME
jgi:hypothetical protein